MLGIVVALVSRAPRISSCEVKHGKCSKGVGESVHRLISATVTAYAIAYVTHFEWHSSRVEVRRDALVLAALMAVALGVKLLLRGRKNGT